LLEEKPSEKCRESLCIGCHCDVNTEIDRVLKRRKLLTSDFYNCDVISSQDAITVVLCSRVARSWVKKTPLWIGRFERLLEWSRCGSKLIGT